RSISANRPPSSRRLAQLWSSHSLARRTSAIMFVSSIESILPKYIRRNNRGHAPPGVHQNPRQVHPLVGIRQMLDVPAKQIFHSMIGRDRHMDGIALERAGHYALINQYLCQREHFARNGKQFKAHRERQRRITTWICRRGELCNDLSGNENLMP